MLKRAFNLAKKERYKEAEAVLQKILAKNPTWMAWDMLGIVLDKTQRHGKAMEAFQQANKLSKNQPEVIYNMEFCALNLHQYQLACECFRSLIDKRPNDFALWTNLGAAEKALGNFAEALKAFERVCDLKPDFGPGWANRATVLREVELHEQVVQIQGRPSRRMHAQNRRLLPVVLSRPAPQHRLPESSGRGGGPPRAHQRHPQL